MCLQSFGSASNAVAKRSAKKVSVTLWFSRSDAVVQRSVLSVLSSWVVQKVYVCTIDFVSGDNCDSSLESFGKKHDSNRGTIVSQRDSNNQKSWLESLTRVTLSLTTWHNKLLFIRSITKKYNFINIVKTCQNIYPKNCLRFCPNFWQIKAFGMRFACTSRSYTTVAGGVSFCDSWWRIDQWCLQDVDSR